MHILVKKQKKIEKKSFPVRSLWARRMIYCKFNFRFSYNKTKYCEKSIFSDSLQMNEM
jgi:hypothetical protein